MPLLNWLTRDEDLRAADRVPYRLLDEVPELSRGGGDGPDQGNLLVQGDNLEALKALLPFYAGRVKCIYIDPPYNTRSAFEHYDDSLEHSKWLAMIVPRLMLLREFLSEDGSIWVSIDDNEGHYLKVVMDEIFGRRNFVSNIVWQSKDTPGNNSSSIAETHTTNLVYSTRANWRPNLLPRTNKQTSTYKNPDNDPRGPWLGTTLTRAEHRDRDFYPLTAPDGREVWPPKGSSWRRPPEALQELLNDGRVWWGADGRAEFPKEKKFLSEVKAGVIPQTWWPYNEFGSTRNANTEMKRVFEGEVTFDTPKPERLLERILHISTNPGDLVLDSFLGSGTTAAVAHKMGRRWIGIEMGDHARTHCALRMEKVIGGEQGGISKDVGWEGGGGFRFCTLGQPVFAPDGRVDESIRFADLARHIWFSELRQPLDTVPDSPLLGVTEGRAVALLFNGILKDRSAGGGNVLTRPHLKLIRDDLTARAPDFDGDLVVYGAACRLSENTLRAEAITFRQTPYEIPARS